MLNNQQEKIRQKELQAQQLEEQRQQFKLKTQNLLKFSEEAPEPKPSRGGPGRKKKERSGDIYSDGEGGDGENQPSARKKRRARKRTAGGEGEGRKRKRRRKEGGGGDENKKERKKRYMRRRKRERERERGTTIILIDCLTIERGVAKLPLPRTMMSSLATLRPRAETPIQEMEPRGRGKEESFQKRLFHLQKKVQTMKQWKRLKKL